MSSVSDEDVLRCVPSNRKKKLYRIMQCLRKGRSVLISRNEVEKRLVELKRRGCIKQIQWLNEMYFQRTVLGDMTLVHPFTSKNPAE